jgi:hypothetical protein
MLITQEFDAIVIGSGQAGSPLALIEREHMGGARHRDERHTRHDEDCG